MKINGLLPSLMLFCSPALAAGFGLDSLRSGDIAAVQAPSPSGPASAAAPAAPREWTIIALINGKNSLSDAALQDLNEMEAVGSTPAVDIVAEVGTVSEKEGKPAVYSVKRYHVAKDNDISAVSSVPLMELKKADMGSWEHLAGFVKWAKAKYPAKRYMVVVWNHGSGWKSSGKPLAPLPAAASRGISYDDETNNHITALEMAGALSAAGGADLLASDACLMQELATNYEIRRYAGVIVGSEETEPNEGQDYSRFLAALAARPAASAEEAARMYVAAYSDYYRSTRNDTTISAVRAASFDGLAAKVTALADAMLADGDMQFARDSRRKTLKFDDSDARDLGHFARVVAGDAKTPAVREAARELYSYLEKEVVIVSAFTSRPPAAVPPGSRLAPGEPASARDFSNATGLAAYIPVVYLPEDNYDVLSFAKASSWTELIKRMKSSQSDPDYWDDFPDD